MLHKSSSHGPTEKLQSSRFFQGEIKRKMASTLSQSKNNSDAPTQQWLHIIPTTYQRRRVDGGWGVKSARVPLRFLLRRKALEGWSVFAPPKQD